MPPKTTVSPMMPMPTPMPIAPPVEMLPRLPPLPPDGGDASGGGKEGATMVNSDFDFPVGALKRYGGSVRGYMTYC